MRHLSAGNASMLAAPAQPNLRYYGFNVHETAGQPATIIIHHSITNAGPALATITLAAHESLNDWPQEGGAASPNGIFVERVAGSAELAVFFRN